MKMWLAGTSFNEDREGGKDLRAIYHCGIGVARGSADVEAKRDGEQFWECEGWRYICWRRARVRWEIAVAA